MRSHLPHCLRLRPTRAFIPQTLAGTLQLLNQSRLQLPNTFCSRLLNTCKPKDLSDPLVEDRHTYLRAFPDIVQISEAYGKHSALSFRHTILPAVTQNLFDYRSFKQKFAAFILAALWTQRWFTRRGDRYFCQSSDRSLHTWSSKSDRSSLYCHSGPVGRQHADTL